MPTPQDLSLTKQHRNDRWDRCTASAGDWLKITTAEHRSANQRFFMHNSATVHRMRMQSTALDSSRSQLCNQRYLNWRRATSDNKMAAITKSGQLCCCAPLAVLERFCSTLSWRRNRTNVASEARPRFSTLSWYVNHVTSGLATVSRRSRFFSHLGRFVVRRDPHLFDLGTRGWEAHTFLCLEEGAQPHPGYLGFTSS